MCARSSTGSRSASGGRSGAAANSASPDHRRARRPPTPPPPPSCGQPLLASADNESLIAWDIGKDGGNEFHNRLVLVIIGSDKIVPLSGFRKGNDGAADRWTPVFAERR